jgi:hypothetical protein
MCERLRRESPVLSLMTPWYLRWLLKPFIDAGATAADVLHGLDVREDDSRWTYTWQSRDEIRHPAGWVRHRLSAWIGADGHVLPLPSQRRAAADAERRAEQEARRREWERMAAAAGRVPEPRPAAEDTTTAAAGVESAAPAAGPNAAYRVAREELERRRREKEAAELPVRPIPDMRAGFRLSMPSCRATRGPDLVRPKAAADWRVWSSVAAWCSVRGAREGLHGGRRRPIMACLVLALPPTMILAQDRSQARSISL